MPSRKKDYGPSDRPLRLRIRRDGTVALTGVGGGVDDPERRFPPRHLFTNAWLFDNVGDGKPVHFDGDRLTLRLCNGEGVYRLTPDEHQRGFWGELVGESYSDVPKINEKRAAAIQAERAKDGA